MMCPKALSRFFHLVTSTLNPKAKPVELIELEKSFKDVAYDSLLCSYSFPHKLYCTFVLNCIYELLKKETNVPPVVVEAVAAMESFIKGEIQRSDMAAIIHKTFDYAVGQNPKDPYFRLVIHCAAATCFESRHSGYSVNSIGVFTYSVVHSKMRETKAAAIYKEILIKTIYECLSPVEKALIL
jgi:hypothetical protein